MYEFCIQIGGQRHCFRVPLLVDFTHFHHPPPNNLPPLELAATVAELATRVSGSDLSKELLSVVTRYVATLQQQLPKGVNIQVVGHEAT